MRRVLVIGAGIFGLTAALELVSRGAEVRVVDPGPIPHPLAESTDISKVIRADYGSDELYSVLMERALERWRDWNRTIVPGLFHECGVLFVTRETMQPSGFEYESYRLLRARGHRLERMTSDELRRRFPSWSGADVGGYYNHSGGWAAGGAVVSALANRARAAGVTVHEGVQIVAEELEAGRARALRTQRGERLEADVFVFTVGCWAAGLLRDLRHCFRATGHPVLHFVPADLGAFDEDRFPVFGADISRTGVYGFPAIGGVVKVASHGPGRLVDPSSPSERTVTACEEGDIRATLREALPALGAARCASSRTCVYCDTHDGDLWIAPDPERPNRIVASGGSGHAFKFAPILGAIIADACEGVVVPRFRWRPEIGPKPPADAARQV